MNNSRSVSVFLGLFLFMIPFPALKAQQLIAQHADIVMINGNHISGQLYINGSDSSFIIKSTDEVMLTIPLNVIKSVNFISHPIESNPGNSKIKIFNNTSFGLAIGKSGELAGSAGNFTAETVVGIIFKPWLRAGLGVGYDQYDLSSVVPCFISISGNLKEKNFTPVYFIEAGTSAAWAYASNSYYSQYANADGKFMIQFGLGYRVYLEKNVNIGFSIGYRMQRVVYSSDFGYESVVSDVNYRRLVFIMGMGF